MPKRPSLICWENLPETLHIANYSNLVEKAATVYVTEDLVGDQVDILIDEDNKIAFRVNGVARGEDYRFWSSYFKKTYDLNHLHAHIDFKPVVIRMTGVRNPLFLKAWAIAHWDRFNEESRYVPWESLEQLCRVLRVDKMPQILAGRPDMKKYDELARIPVVGSPKIGLLLIPDIRPIRYIKRPNEAITPSQDKSHTERNVSLAKNLAKEFSQLALDPITLIENSIGSAEKACEHVKKSNQYLFFEYVNRCISEAGISEQEGNELLEKALMERAQHLL